MTMDMVTHFKTALTSLYPITDPLVDIQDIKIFGFGILADDIAGMSRCDSLYLQATIDGRSVNGSSMQSYLPGLLVSSIFIVERYEWTPSRSIYTVKA